MLDKKVEELRDEFLNSLVEILKINSVEGKKLPGMPFGEGPNEALEKALEICDDLGFTTVNLDGYVGYAEYGTGEDYVAVLGHLDVVPEGDGWIYPPYGAEIHDGKLYARGVMDDKGPIFAALYGLKAIKDLGLSLSKRVRIIFGTNEESGSHDMPYYVEREKQPVAGFTPDGMFPIINGEKETGLTAFWLDEGVDTGRIIDRAAYLLNPSFNFGQTYRNLAEGLTPNFCMLVIERVIRGDEGEEQVVTGKEKKAPKLTRANTWIDWGEPAGKILDFIRGLSPKPGALSLVFGQECKILEAWGETRMIPDPKIEPDAIRFEEISYLDVLNKDLKVMDSTATSLCRDNHMPLLVFAISDPENIVRAVKGEKIGTIVKE